MPQHSATEPSPPDLGPRPRVALETTVLSYGLPWPANRDLARDLHGMLLEMGVDASTSAILDGALRCDLSLDETLLFCTKGDTASEGDPVLSPQDAPVKTSLANLPAVLARGARGATTVATTMLAAHSAGIPVMATGGIGGVHLRLDASQPLDESADLLALSRYPITVVCAGPKAILDVAATRERLETLGVPVVGYGTDYLPAFYCGETPHAVDVRCDSAAEVARIVRERDRMGLQAAVLVVVPHTGDTALDWDEVQNVVRTAMAAPAARALAPSGVTPYLLDAVRARLGARALQANIDLLKRNARVAGNIAQSLTCGS